MRIELFWLALISGAGVVLDARRAKHHTVGVIPDHDVRRTIAGVRAGRDEVLDEALRLVEAKMSR